MRRGVVTMLLVLSLGYLIIGKATSLRSYQELPADELIATERTLAIERMGAAAQNQETPAAKKKRQQAQLEYLKVKAELLIRQFFIDQLMMVIFVIALFLLIANRLKSRQAFLPTSRDELIRDMSVEVLTPTEVYVDEYELDQAVNEGFKKKEDAIAWLKSDPMLTCDYCGSPLRSTFTGKRESVQMTTFYKHVPAGAKDMRVVLGTFWFAKHATELRCSQCGKTEHR